MHYVRNVTNPILVGFGVNLVTPSIFSGNKEIDVFIQKFQLNATRHEEVLEWIPYEKFSNVEYFAKGGFGTVHKAKWIYGDIQYWDISQNEWNRNTNRDIVLKSLNNSQNITTDFLQEVCNLLFIILYLQKCILTFN